LHTKRNLVEDEPLIDLIPNVDELLDIKAPPAEKKKKRKKQTRVSERLKKAAAICGYRVHC
jgi:hypothetical protein